MHKSKHADIENLAIELTGNGYDYERQAWVSNGVYVRCGHPESMACDCYGKLHAGEKAAL